MLHLRKDLFARLVISAHKNRKLNSLFRVSHVEMSTFYTQKKHQPIINQKFIEASKIEKEVSNTPISGSTVTKIVPKGPAPEKIDEKVSKMIDDPKLDEITEELEFAEELLRRIKLVDKDNKKIPIIAANISKLKSMLAQKRYV